MPDEIIDDVPERLVSKSSVVCDLCGSSMRPAGGCWICTHCGQKKCSTDLT